MNNLLQILTQETQTLKKQYLQMTQEWAVKEFNYLKQWIKDYQSGKFGFGEASKKYARIPHYIHSGKVEQHIQKKCQEAEQHYQTSIQKLTTRIEKKGLCQERIKIKTSHIGVNIETVLTDGDKSVRAFTIIAGGEIQRPHYRYLVK